MKKSINTAGIAFLILLFIGIVFKRLHLAGAGVITTLSIFLFVTVYMPSFLVSIYRQLRSEGSQMSKYLIFIGAPGVIVLTFGVLAKIMHWPGAAIGLWGGIGLISLAFLLYLILNRKVNERISMISVMIAIIILGSFSFNTFRMGNIRPIEDAYIISGASYSESSRIFWNECEYAIKTKIIPDTSKVSPVIKGDLLKIHSLVQEADLAIGRMIEGIKISENSLADLPKSSKKSDNLNKLLYNVILGENGLDAMDKKIVSYKDMIDSLSGLSAEEKTSLKQNLTYTFDYKDSGLLFKYLGAYKLDPQICESSLLLWKSKIWETEYQLISMLSPT